LSSSIQIQYFEINDELAVEERDRETCYYPDPVTQYLDHLRDLIERNTKDELTAELAAIRDDIDSWKDQYPTLPDSVR
jgi:predicted oxidoreductase